MRRRALVVGALLLTTVSCSSPDPSYYTLGADPRHTACRAGPSLVELRRPGIAGYLDRSEITRSNTPYPAQSGERRALGRAVRRYGRSCPGGGSQQPTGRDAACSRRRGRSRPTRGRGSKSTCNASMRMRAGRSSLRRRWRSRGTATAGEPATRSIKMSVTPSGSATAAYVAAMSQALASASDDIAALLRRP